MLVLALCLFETLKTHQIPRPLREVGDLSGQSYKDLSKLHKKLFSQSDPILASSLVFRFGSLLEIAPEHLMKIESYVKSTFDSISFNPVTTVASVLSAYIKIFALGKNLKYISSALKVSKGAIRRHWNIYPFLLEAATWKAIIPDGFEGQHFGSKRYQIKKKFWHP